MTKTYSLKALRPLFQMARGVPPLLGNFEPFGNGIDPWIVRWIADSAGLWLQVNDHYGIGGPLSIHQIKMSGFNVDDLECSYLDGIGYSYGLPGGKPILPFPFTAMQLFRFDRQLGGLVRDYFHIGADEAETELTELEQTNPDAAELARIIFSGVMPEDLATPSVAQVVALVLPNDHEAESAESEPDAALRPAVAVEMGRPVGSEVRKAESEAQAAPSPAPAPAPAPAVTKSLPNGVVAEKVGPWPLTTNEVANCFAGFREWDVKRWKRELGSPDKWLQACQQSKGKPGRGCQESTWWPVKIAMSLASQDPKLARGLQARFKRFDKLRPWLEELEINTPDNSDIW